MKAMILASTCSMPWARWAQALCTRRRARPRWTLDARRWEELLAEHRTNAALYPTRRKDW